MRDLTAMRTKLDQVDSDSRTVGLWNSLRDKFRQEYGENAIYALDASGFISEWLRG